MIVTLSADITKALRAVQELTAEVGLLADRSEESFGSERMSEPFVMAMETLEEAEEYLRTAVLRHPVDV